jgi:probable addiction module antidote protein
MHTGNTTSPGHRSRLFNAAEHLRSETEVTAYLGAMFEDGDARAIPVALRTVVDAVGGMTAMVDKTGLPRETLYRALSARGNLRFRTLAAILAAFGLSVAVRPARRKDEDY